MCCVKYGCIELARQDCVGLKYDVNGYALTGVGGSLDSAGVDNVVSYRVVWDFIM